MRSTDGSGLSEELQDQIAAGIKDYIQDQQEEAKKEQAEKNKPKVIEGDFTDDDAVLGDEDALVTIIEFSDYELNAGERVETIVEISKNTCRIILHLDDFTGNSADQQIVRNFFIAAIPFTKDFSSYIHGQYEELSEQWKALTIN